MPNPNLTTIGITGTDGVVPIYQPESRWTIWSMSEIYLGQEGASRYVPKINDYVIDPPTFTTYIVRDINPVTLIAELVIISPNIISTDTHDLILGVADEAFRAYLDTSVFPYTLALDPSAMVPGSMIRHCRIFRGYDLSDTGEVISLKYDNSGNLIGNLIMLETVAMNSHDNYAIKVAPPCNCVVEMPDGERVTAVYYDDNAHVVKRIGFVVENTSYIRQAFAEEKFITGISIKTPFLSTQSDTIINFPINIPLNALGLVGVVHYSDGSIIEYPVNGLKFKMFGLEQYVSSIIGHNVPLVLSYTLGENEAVYGAVTSDGKYITKPYKLVTSEPNNSYNVKLMGYPEWMSDAQGYNLRWFMLNLDRNVFQDVTGKAVFAENTGAFNPTSYGYVQRKSVNLNLAEVSGMYRPFIHTQLVDIILRGAPNNTVSPWEVSMEVTSNTPMYGQGLRAVRESIDKKQFTIHSDIVTASEWLDSVYYKTKPLINGVNEIEPIRPSHIEVFYLDRTQRISIDDWNETLNLGVMVPLYKNVYLKFLKQTGSGDLILSVAALPVMV